MAGSPWQYGEPDGSRSERMQTLAQTLIAAGLRAPVRTRLRGEIWVKLWGNVALNPLTTLTRSTLATASQVRQQLAEGAGCSGRDPAGIVVASLLPTMVAETRAEALAALRPGLAFYAGFFPRYNRLMAEHGFADEAAAIAAAWARGDREAAERAVSDAMIDASSIAGTPEECRDRIEAYRQSGIDLPILSPFARGPGSKARFEAVIRACAPLDR